MSKKCNNKISRNNRVKNVKNSNEKTNNNISKKLKIIKIQKIFLKKLKKKYLYEERVPLKIEINTLSKKLDEVKILIYQKIMK